MNLNYNKIMNIGIYNLRIKFELQMFKKIFVYIIYYYNSSICITYENNILIHF